jgi:hypothetical protein
MMGIGHNLHSHRLRRHNREVLRRREVRQSKGVPQHDVLVVEVCVGVRGDPGGDALGGLAGGLGDGWSWPSSSGRVDVLVVWVRW